MRKLSFKNFKDRKCIKQRLGLRDFSMYLGVQTLRVEGSQFYRLQAQGVQQAWRNETGVPVRGRDRNNTQPDLPPKPDFSGPAT